MSEPIFILGCHRSGTSVVAGLLYKACGVWMGKLMPPTGDNPMGHFEALGVVDAHRDILARIGKGLDVPAIDIPAGSTRSDSFRRADRHPQAATRCLGDEGPAFDVPPSRLGSSGHRPCPPRCRGPAACRHDPIYQKARPHPTGTVAEAIVDVYLRRLAEIAEKVRLPVMRFPGKGDSLIRQVRDLAASLNLSWDEQAAGLFFDQALIRHRSELRDTQPRLRRAHRKGSLSEEGSGHQSTVAQAPVGARATSRDTSRCPPHTAG